MKEKLRFLGLDVHAETIAVAVAEPEGEVRSLGTIPNRAESIRKLIGVSALMGTKQSLNRVYTQIAGWGYRCRFETAVAEFGRCGPFQRLALRYVQAQLVQCAQSAGCNAEHSNEQRLARWLLICADRVHSDKFKMSQEFLSHMLGSTRPTVTLAAGRLKEERLITYQRAEIAIVDRKGLEKRACECYGVIKQHLDDFAAFDTDDTK